MYIMILLRYSKQYVDIYVGMGDVYYTVCYLYKSLN